MAIDPIVPDVALYAGATTAEPAVLNLYALIK